jgi:hypothetical protein
MSVLRVCAVSIVLLTGMALGVAGQEEGNPSAPPAFSVEPSAPAEAWTDEHTCFDADFMMPSEASGGSRGDLFNCAKALGLRKRDPAYATYDFRLWGSRFERERWTEQCDEAGDHTGSRYRVSGTDRLWNVERPERVVTGTFDFTVVSALLDPDADIWEVERQGVLWDLHDADGAWSWTWSVDVNSVSEGAPEEPHLTQYRGVDRSELARAVCEYLR